MGRKAAGIPLVLFMFVLLAACTSTYATEVAAVKQKYVSYTIERAAAEGYKKDLFCLDARSLGEKPELGMMGLHSTNESLLRGPIDANTPQALVFDGDGKLVAVEYEIMTDAVSKAPTLLGQRFHMMGSHPGLEHEHYALHLWFVENPNGRFADFNPKYSCPEGSTPPATHGH